MLGAFKSDEPGRLRALERMNVLDTAAQEPFESIVKLVRQVLQVPICAISLLDTNRQWFKAQRGLGSAETDRDVSFCTHTIKSPDPMVIRDAAKDARFAANPLVTGDPGIRSYIGIPLTTSEGYNMGALCAIDTKPRTFSADDIAVLVDFAALAVGELELRQIASTDGLTGALSRRAWFDLAHNEVLRAARHSRALSFLILDIDRFKLINDKFGHAHGDKVIGQVAQIAQAQLRRSDLFGRFGGEEFVCALPETSFADALQLAERIRTSIAAHSRESIAGPDCTVSIGVSSLNRNEQTIDQAFERADQALYYAKRTGRNRVHGTPAATQPVAIRQVVR